MELQQKWMGVLVIVLAKTVTNSDLGKFANVFFDTAAATTRAAATDTGAPRVATVRFLP
jgi:hypothetical protein